MINYVSLRLRRIIQRIQSELAFESWCMYPQFNSPNGIGRVATIALILGVIWGVNVCLFGLGLLHHLKVLEITKLSTLVSPARTQLILQWFGYCVIITTFHLSEFFVTALCNPTVVSSNSFVVNHSHAYTAAAILSSLEFWTRFIFFPTINNVYLAILGCIVVVAGQTLRIVSIATCGESFNHLIQTAKKDTHVLVTRGIYAYLRHPSYVAFFYWCIGSQLFLCNPVHTIIFTAASWLFFQRRISYEEESLQFLFPDTYRDYARTTWIGIPFIKVHTNS